MAYKIVFFDIDGTLVNEAREIPHSTKEAIKKLQHQNIHVLIATGRAPSQFKFIAEELGIDSFISCNGSYVLYQNQQIFHQPIPKETLESIEKIARFNQHPIVYAGNEECYSDFYEHPDVLASFSWLRLPHLPIHNKHMQIKKEIYQVYLYCSSAEERIYTQTLQNTFSFIRPHPLYMDVFLHGISKATGIQAVLKHLQISPFDAVAFGDGLNDKEMLSYVGMGIAMGNAHPDLIAHAKFITKPVEDDGILHGLTKIGLL